LEAMAPNEVTRTVPSCVAWAFPLGLVPAAAETGGGESSEARFVPSSENAEEDAGGVLRRRIGAFEVLEIILSPPSCTESGGMVAPEGPLDVATGGPTFAGLAVPAARVAGVKESGGRAVGVGAGRVSAGTGPCVAVAVTGDGTFAGGEGM
jgi:hypothetical protein